MNKLSLNFIVISLKNDFDFIKTNNSIEEFIKKIKLTKLNKISFNLFHILSKSDTNNNNYLSEEMKKIFENYFFLIAKDNSLYDAMNQSIFLIKEKNLCSANHFSIFLNSGSEIIFSNQIIDYLSSMIVDLKNYIPKENPTILLTGTNVKTKYMKSYSKKWLPTRIDNNLPFRMPACHQSIFYRSNILIHFPFLNLKGFLAADFLQILSILDFGFKSHSMDLVTVKYFNDGLSFKSPIESIFQRYFVRFLFKNRRYLILIFLCFDFLKEVIWRIVFFKKLNSNKS